MAIGMMLSGCGYTLVSTEDLLQLNQTPVQEELEEQEEELEREPLQEERLEEQLLAVLNLNADDDKRVVASSSLDTAGSFFMGVVLDGLQNGNSLEELKGELEAMVSQQDLFIFIYDGALSLAQAGKKALADIQGKKGNWGGENPAAINVSYGSAGEHSVWMILAKGDSL